MKITANVEVSYWQQPAVGRRPSQRSSVVIGKQSTTKELFLLVQNAQNKAGVKYKIADNVDRLFTRFVAEGKATLRFRNPPHDLILKCEDTVLFRSFLNVLKQGSRDGGEGVPDTRLSSLYSTASVPKKAVTKMEITSPADYPHLGVFPRTLQSLSINGISMRRVETKVTRLRNLVVLDLADNLLEVVPAAVGDLPLSTLSLAGNRLGSTAAPVDWSFLDGRRLAATLRSLDLGRNSIGELPAMLGDVRGLVALGVAGNELTSLPGSVGLLGNLRNLSISDNRVTHLPGRMRKLRLDLIDVSGNAFGAPYDLPGDDGRRFGLGSEGVLRLQELAARTILTCRLRYRGVLPGPLCARLASAHLCVCGGASTEATLFRPSEVDLGTVAATVVAGVGGCHVPALDAFCTARCAGGAVRRPSEQTRKATPSS